MEHDHGKAADMGRRECRRERSDDEHDAWQQGWFPSGQNNTFFATPDLLLLNWVNARTLDRHVLQLMYAPRAPSL
jgi:hypothetical protein